MSTDVQHFDSDGTWVKPPGAVRLIVSLKGGTGASSRAYVDAGRSLAPGGGGAGDGLVPGHTRAPWLDKPGEDGQLVECSFAADEVPDRMDIKIGRGGWAEIVTDLND